jgi:hypothetical protein
MKNGKIKYNKKRNSDSKIADDGLEKLYAFPVLDTVSDTVLIQENDTRSGKPWHWGYSLPENKIKNE